MFCVGLLIEVRIPRIIFLVPPEVYNILWTSEDKAVL